MIGGLIYFGLRSCPSYGVIETGLINLHRTSSGLIFTPFPQILNYWTRSLEQHSLFLAIKAEKRLVKKVKYV